MSTTLYFIYNPTAGAVSNERRIRTAIREMKRLGAGLEMLPTHGPGTATQLARQAVAAGARRIVIAGGDGTINEALNGFDISKTELAIIPVGTANVLAIELGIPLNMKQAAQIAVTGKPARIDLGLAGERYFVLMAGIGFDAMAIKNINPALKKAIRHAAFPISGIKTLVREELPLLQVTMEEKAAEGYMVVASNSRFYGGRFGPTPEASVNDGLLDVCVLKEKNFYSMLNFWLRALAKSTLDSQSAEYFRVPKLKVMCPGGEKVLVQTDGDLIGELPMEFSVLPNALKVCRGRL